MATELIRSGYDIDGVRVELLFDDDIDRFTVATRWTNLVHFPIPFKNDKWKRIMLDRASATFEVVCMDGATKENARKARRIASENDRIFFRSSADYEREILRQTA